MEKNKQNIINFSIAIMLTIIYGTYVLFGFYLNIHDWEYGIDWSSITFLSMLVFAFFIGFFTHRKREIILIKKSSSTLIFIFLLLLLRDFIFILKERDYIVSWVQYLPLQSLFIFLFLACPIFFTGAFLIWSRKRLNN